MASLLGGGERAVQLSAAGAAIGLFALTYLGADLATRFQFVIMAILAAALVSFFAGARARWDPALLDQA